MTKEEVILLAKEKLQHKQSRLREILDNLEASHEQEEKSSAGDKFETGRERVAQEIDLVEKQLNEINDQLNLLKQPAFTEKRLRVTTGAWVETNLAHYLIGVGIGSISTNVYGISSDAPIYEKIKGLQPGETFTTPQGLPCEIIRIS